jgi:HK97 family phage major capsid protein
MAITAATVTGDFSAGFLDPAEAGPIFERAAQISVVQRLVRQVPLGINGTEVPVVTGRPSAAWVSEGGTKPASSGAMTLKTIAPKKLASIMVVSAEVVRANPGNYVATMRESLAEAFALAFDQAALHDAGPDGTGGAGPFATYIDQTTKVQELGATPAANGGVYRELVAAIDNVVTDADASGRRYRLNGWALDTVTEPTLLLSVDSNGRPLFVDTPFADTTTARGGNLIGRPAFMGEGVSTQDLTSVVGYGGDWSQAAWGVIGGISYKVSTEAAVTINGSLTSLFEHNLVAILAEAEYGFLCNDPEAFVKLTNTTGS